MRDIIKQEEYFKCRDDKEYFINTYCKRMCATYGTADVDLYDYQKDLLSEKYLIATTARQIGFSMLAALDAFHSIVFDNYKTIAFVAPTMKQVEMYRILIKMLYETTTYFKDYLPLMSTDTMNRMRFDNDVTILYTSAKCSHIRGQSINTVYMSDVDYVSKSDYVAFMHSIAPIILCAKNSKMWIWSGNGNGNINHEEKYLKSFKRVVLPFWVTDNNLYNRHKYMSEILGDDNAKKELLTIG